MVQPRWLGRSADRRDLLSCIEGTVLDDPPYNLWLRPGSGTRDIFASCGDDVALAVARRGNTHSAELHPETVNSCRPVGASFRDELLGDDPQSASVVGVDGVWQNPCQAV